MVDGNWSNIEALPFTSDEYSTEHPSLSPDGSKLYFASDMPGSKGSFDIYVVDVNADGTFSTPQNLGAVNTEKREQFPLLVMIMFYTFLPTDIRDLVIWMFSKQKVTSLKSKTLEQV